MEAKEIIKLLAPPFKKIPDDVLDAWIFIASDYVSEDFFGDKYQKALALYTLHIATAGGAMKGENESISSYSQRVSSMSITGAWQKTFAETAAAGFDYGSTPWGAMYERLLMECGGGFGLMAWGCNGL